MADLYVFLQQRDHSCHITSWANLARLKSFRAQARLADGQTIDLTKIPGVWQTRMDQLPEVNGQLIAWQTGLSMALNDPAVRAYNDQDKEKGIRCAELYTAKGKQYHNDTWNPIESIYRKLYAPNTIIDVALLGDDGEELAKESSNITLPIYFHKGKMRIFDPSTKAHQEITDFTGPKAHLTEAEANDVSLIKLKLPNEQWITLRLSDEYRNAYKLDLAENITLEGKSNVFGQEVAFQKLYLPQEALDYTKYFSSLYDLILLNLGIDRNGETITSEHPLYTVYQGMTSEMQKFTENPWVDHQLFNKDNSLEVQIAQIVKNNPELKAELKKHINFSSFFHPHQYFEDLSKLYTSKNKETRVRASDLVGQYIPNEDLMLSYHLVSMLTTLWGAGKSYEAFMAVRELDEIPLLSKIFKLYGMPGSHQLLKAAYKKQDDQQCFVDIWLKIKSELLKSDTKEYVSYCDHGRVISFADDLRYLQEQHGAEHPEVLQELGFAVVDSYFPQQLNPFYKKTDKSLPTASLPITGNGNLPAGATFKQFERYQYKTLLDNLLDLIKSLVLKLAQMLGLAHKAAKDEIGVGQSTQALSSNNSVRQTILNYKRAHEQFENPVVPAETLDILCTAENDTTGATSIPSASAA